MARLNEYVAEVRSMSRAAFVRAHPHPFLLLCRRREEGRQNWLFKTQTISISSPLSPEAAGREGGLPPELAKYEIFPIAKAAANPWNERVSVGRARNNDIVLTDSSVSKLHAHFRVATEAEAQVVDAGSRNGTSINDRLLVKGEVVKVMAGDHLMFGRTRLTLMDAGGLYEFMSRHLNINT